MYIKSPQKGKIWEESIEMIEQNKIQEFEIDQKLL